MNYSDSNNFLQVVLDTLVDGILVLTVEQEVLYSNRIATSICTQLASGQTKHLPESIQQVSAALIDSRDLYADRPVVIELEVKTSETTLRIRAQWLKLEVTGRPCILVRLQDQKLSLQGLAITESQQWNLTSREREVWLLRRAGLTRKEIGSQLYITENTVQKHLKNVQVKRNIALDEDEWRNTRAS
jgi:DNA-binding CsgD family transcriptional regulator